MEKLNIHKINLIGGIPGKSFYEILKNPSLFCDPHEYRKWFSSPLHFHSCGIFTNKNTKNAPQSFKMRKKGIVQ
jgi:hypothetical protein